MCGQWVECVTSVLLPPLGILLVLQADNCLFAAIFLSSGVLMGVSAIEGVQSVIIHKRSECGHTVQCSSVGWCALTGGRHWLRLH